MKINNFIDSCLFISKNINDTTEDEQSNLDLLEDNYPIDLKNFHCIILLIMN